MLKFAKFIGANTDFATAQAYIFPRVFNEASDNPIFGLVITCEGDDVFIQVRQNILDLEEQFSSPFERITDKLHELSQTLKARLNQVDNLNFTLFCAKESVFYVLQYNDKQNFSSNNTVEILRDGERTSVVSESSLQEKVVSGFIKAQDRILVLSARPGERSWSAEVIKQTFSLPLDDVDDAESIFAQNELKHQNQEDLAGVKNIEPVAFILIHNYDGELSKGSAFAEERPKTDFKLKLPSLHFLFYLRSFSRRIFGVLRRTDRRILVGLSGALVVIVILGTIFLYFKSRESGKNERLENLISLAQNHLNQAQNLKDSDIKGASSELSQAKINLKDLVSLDEKNSQVQEIKSQIEVKESEILRIYKNPRLELFLSLDLLKPNFKAEKLSFSVDKILLLDINEKSLISVDTKLKTPNILAGSQQLGNAQAASINGSDVFVYSTDKGLLNIDTDTNKLIAVSKPDEGWGNIRDIFGFSGNVYVLDIGKNMIWKYFPSSSGFSQKQEYLRSEVDLSLGKRLVIDYSVWVLTSDADILKFTAGNKDFYAISGLDQPLNQIDGIFIPEELDSVFILDKLNNRLLVTKKNGEYQAQYIGGDLGKVQDFFVNEEEKAIYLLIDNKIFKTPLL